MKIKKRISMIMAILMTMSLAACNSSNDSGTDGDSGTKATKATKANDTTDANAASTDTIKEFTMFIGMYGAEKNSTNINQQKLAELTGAKCKETWLTGQTVEEAVGMMVAGGELPDFIEPGNGKQMCLDAGVLVPLDEHWDNYPNIKNYLSEAEWNMVRNEDGHVYSMPQFGIINGYDTATYHDGEAWWIQPRVLKWANYPKITTIDEYFKLLEDYAAANPTHYDGSTVIPYTILSEDWRYYCLENPPMFLAGYPNDGCAIVDPVTAKVESYNTTDTAKMYFKKLNDMYKKGIVDPESFTQSYDQYIAKISTGRVLGFVDQYWNFRYSAVDSITTLGYNDCTYVPLGIVSEEGIVEQYHNAPTIDVSGGFSITTSCKDLEGALQFVNDLLGVEAMTLRFWGAEGQDYMVGDDGLYYRNQEMRDNAADATYKASNLCEYSYFPQYQGMNLDGKNSWNPETQPAEFFGLLKDEVKECLSAYGAQTFVEMLNPSTENKPWFPLWSYSNDMTTATPGGQAKLDMDEVKHEYLPTLVVADDFEAAWENYMSVYNSRVDTEAYLSELQAEVDRRIAIASGS